MELFAATRRDARVEGMSIRALARKHQVGRATVRQALASAEPPPRKTPVRASPRLDPFKAAIDGMLRADRDAPCKQRHTARRIHVRLIEEHNAVQVSFAARHSDPRTTSRYDRNRHNLDRHAVHTLAAYASGAA